MGRVKDEITLEKIVNRLEYIMRNDFPQYTCKHSQVPNGKVWCDYHNQIPAGRCSGCAHYDSGLREVAA